MGSAGPFRLSSALIPAIGADRRSLLLAALASPLGDMGARRFLRDVLADSSREDVPTDSDRFDTFVRDDLLPRLIPMVSFAEIEQFTKRALRRGESVAGRVTLKATPVMDKRARARVIVLDPDPFRARELCCVLVRDGFDVEAADDGSAVTALQPFDVLVVRPDAQAEGMLAELALAGVQFGVVFFDAPSERKLIRGTIRMWANDRVTVAAVDASPALVAARVRIVARDH